MHNLYKILYFIIILSFCSCQKENSSGSSRSEMVLLVYIGGENNLSSKTYQKIEEMRKGFAGGSKQKLIIYLDTNDGPPSLMEIKKAGATTELKTLRTFEEENSADAAVFSRVISEIIKTYPSNHYALLVFSHASGWLPAGSYADPTKNPSGPVSRSLIQDGSDHMEIADFAAAIPDHLFDYIVFEACHTTGIEFVYELRKKADFILGSAAEIVDPGFTYVYTNSLDYLLNNNPIGFGSAAFEHINSLTGYFRSATLSIVRTSALDPLAEWIKDNCDLEKFVDPSTVQNFDWSSSDLFYDFQDYWERLAEGENKKKELQKLLDECVVWKASTPYFMPGVRGAFRIDRHSGMSCYIPQDKYSYLNREYLKLSWSKFIYSENSSY